MSMPRRVLAWLLPLGATLVLLAGCTTATPPANTSSPATTTSSPTASTPGTSSPTASASSPTATASPVCAAADAFAEALTGFKDTLKPGATLEQINSALDQVEKAYEDLLSTAGSAAQARVDAVRSAEEQLAAAVNDIPDDATLTSAIDSLRDEVATVQAALSDFASQVRC